MIVALRHRTLRVINAAGALSAGLLLLASSGCASQLFLQSQHVAITGVPMKVHGCHALGNVQDDSESDDYDDRLTAIREDAVRRGGNTVLMMSPATSNNGVAYLCNPPVKPDNQG